MNSNLIKTVKKTFFVCTVLLSFILTACPTTPTSASETIDTNLAEITINGSSSDISWAFWSQKISSSSETVHIDFSVDMAVENSGTAATLMWQTNTDSYPIIAQHTFPNGSTNWITISGQKTVSGVSSNSEIYLSTYNLTASNLKIYLKNFKINVTSAELKIQESSNANGQTLKGGAEKCGFKMGGVLNADQMTSENYKILLKSDFNSVTFGNELKPYSLLNQSASKQAGKPAFNWTTADSMLQWCKDNGMKVRGHVLVWDSVMNNDWINWFFKENFDSNGKLVNSETMKGRVKSMINDVIVHCETKFPGVIYAWDVVNEAVADSDSDCADWKVSDGNTCRIRTTRNGARNYYYDTIGKDYVKYSFEYAREVVDTNKYNIKLFYNDYSTFYSPKKDYIIKLIKELNSEKKLCDGMGMQSYIGGWSSEGSTQSARDNNRQNGCFNQGDLTNFESAVKDYAKLGVEVHITECAIRNFKNSESELKKHKEFYVKFVQLLKKVNSNNNNPITSFSIWGLTDLDASVPDSNYSYTMNGPYGGLYTCKQDDSTFAKKDVYYAVLEELNK